MLLLPARFPRSHEAAHVTGLVARRGEARRGEEERRDAEAQDEQFSAASRRRLSMVVGTGYHVEVEWQMMGITPVRFGELEIVGWRMSEGRPARNAAAAVGGRNV